MYSQEQLIRDRIINFFAFVFFGGLAALFLYYKLLGGIGFNVSANFFDLKSGIINITIAVVVGVLSVSLKRGNIGARKMLNFLMGITILGFTIYQLIIWYFLYEDGLFIGGDILKTLGIDDLIYFTLYYFITGFQLIFALGIAVSYFKIFAKGENDNSYFNTLSLYKLIQPLIFSIVCIFIFYHFWN